MLPNRHGPYSDTIEGIVWDTDDGLDSDTVVVAVFSLLSLQGCPQAGAGGGAKSPPTQVTCAPYFFLRYKK